MQLIRGQDTIELLLHSSDQRKLQRGFVVHGYSAPHYKQGGEIVAVKLELPSVQQYRRLGYTVAVTIHAEQIRGHRVRIPRATPAVQQAQGLLAQAQALLAQSTKGKVR